VAGNGVAPRRLRLFPVAAPGFRRQSFRERDPANNLQISRRSDRITAFLSPPAVIVTPISRKIAKNSTGIGQKSLGVQICMVVTISLSWPEKDFAVPDFLSSRGAPRRKKRGEAGITRKVAPAVDEAAAADPKAPDSGIPTPSEQPHRPWLVPGAGKL
jgi:hypothetical protein